MAFVRLPGKARRYLDTISGEELSYHKAIIQPRLQELGWKSGHERAQYRKSDEYKRFEIQDKLEKEAKNQKFDREQFEKQFAAVKNDKFDTSPKGKFSQFLVSIGMREPDANYPVGSTPPKKR